ncbi:MAG TPA: hypothetical protein VGD40_18705 [Chryseosolibacter sp.]
MKKTNMITTRKLNYLFIALVAALFSCSKDDATPMACSFKFNSKDYVAPGGLCIQTERTPGTYVTALTAANGQGNEQWVLNVEEGGTDLNLYADQINYFMGSGGKITFSNNQFTFSGNLVHPVTRNVAGTIEGSCSCTSSK